MNRLSWFSNRIRGLQPALDGKANAVHTHTISDLTDLPAIAKSSTGDAIIQANATGKINDSWLPTYLPRLNTANTWTGNQTLSAAGSTDEAPREIMISGGVGDRGRLAVAGTGNALQGGNGVKTQLLSYWGIEIGGNRRAGASEFIAYNIDTDTCVRMYATFPTTRLLVLQGADGQSGELLIFRNYAGTRLASVNAAGAFLAPAGSAASPSISLVGDQNTGIYSSIADTLEFSTAGVRRAALSSQGLTVDAGPTGSNGVINAKHSGGASITIENTGTGGGLWRWVATNDSYSVGGQKLYLIQDVISTSQPIMMIASGRFGFGRGMLNPKATVHGIGSTILGAATSAVADADMGNGQINPYVDEVAHTLKIKVKYSNGTIRTATIALAS